MDNNLFEQAKMMIFYQRVIFLLESMEYSRLSFINDAVDILKVLKIRIERGDINYRCSFFRNLYFKRI